MDDFEKRIQGQPLRQIPNEWRTEILAAAKPVSRLAPHASFLSTLNHQLSTILWPHPRAWAAMAAVWIFIFALNFSMRDMSPRIAEKSTPPSPEVIVELKKQRQLFAELMGSREIPDADRQKIFLQKPRSERVEILMT